jgi:hypothetical protein
MQVSGKRFSGESESHLVLQLAVQRNEYQEYSRIEVQGLTWNLYYPGYEKQGMEFGQEV